MAGPKDTDLSSWEEENEKLWLEWEEEEEEEVEEEETAPPLWPVQEGTHWDKCSPTR